MSKSWTSPPHAVNLRQFFDNIYNLRLLRNIPVTSRRRSCSRYRNIFPAWKNVKYQYGQGAKCSSTNTEVFHSQACTFPEESFILSSPCNSACYIGWRNWFLSIDSWAPLKFTNSGSGRGVMWRWVRNNWCGYKWEGEGFLVKKGSYKTTARDVLFTALQETDPVIY